MDRVRQDLQARPLGETADERRQRIEHDERRYGEVRELLAEQEARRGRLEQRVLAENRELANYQGAQESRMGAAERLMSEGLEGQERNIAGLRQDFEGDRGRLRALQAETDEADERIGVGQQSLIDLRTQVQRTHTEDQKRMAADRASFEQDIRDLTSAQGGMNEAQHRLLQEHAMELEGQISTHARGQERRIGTLEDTIEELRGGFRDRATPDGMVELDDDTLDLSLARHRGETLRRSQAEEREQESQRAAQEAFEELRRTTFIPEPEAPELSAEERTAAALADIDPVQDPLTFSQVGRDLDAGLTGPRPPTEPRPPTPTEPRPPTPTESEESEHYTQEEIEALELEESLEQALEQEQQEQQEQQEGHLEVKGGILGGAAELMGQGLGMAGEGAMAAGGATGRFAMGIGQGVAERAWESVPAAEDIGGAGGRLAVDVAGAALTGATTIGGAAIAAGGEMLFGEEAVPSSQLPSVPSEPEIEAALEDLPLTPEQQELMEADPTTQRLVGMEGVRRGSVQLEPVGAAELVGGGAAHREVPHPLDDSVEVGPTPTAADTRTSTHRESMRLWSQPMVQSELGEMAASGRPSKKYLIKNNTDRQVEGIEPGRRAFIHGADYEGEGNLHHKAGGSMPYAPVTKTSMAEANALFEAGDLLLETTD